MKLRRPSYAPETLPNISALTQRYERLIFALNVLILTGDYSGVLRTSLDIGRAARALIKGKVAAANMERRFRMLLCPIWRARVISDLGGRRKLALWSAAMARAQLRGHKDNARRAGPSAAAGFVPPHIIAAQEKEARRRADIRACAKAGAHPGVFKDPFRVDGEGQFRLAPIPRIRAARLSAPRAPGVSAALNTARDYSYDPRPINKLTGIYAPASVTPDEFYAAERAEQTSAAPALSIRPASRPAAAPEYYPPKHPLPRENSLRLPLCKVRASP